LLGQRAEATFRFTRRYQSISRVHTHYSTDLLAERKMIETLELVQEEVQVVELSLEQLASVGGGSLTVVLE
jgi:hypothetical protein